MNAQEYAAYRQTKEWQERRTACLQRFDFRCQVCGCTPWRRIVDVHHLHYRNIGAEHPDDLVPLCCVHHETIHNQPDGYDMTVLCRLKRECEDDFWTDPMPSYVRERQLNLRDEYEPLYPTVLCPQCHFRYQFSQDSPYCDSCGASVRPNARPPILDKRNADDLGFTDARLLYEAKDVWKKAGSKKK